MHFLSLSPPVRVDTKISPLYFFLLLGVPKAEPIYPRPGNHYRMSGKDFDFSPSANVFPLLIAAYSKISPLYFFSLLGVSKAESIYP
jgi:hypothetical protein